MKKPCKAVLVQGWSQNGTRLLEEEFEANSRDGFLGNLETLMQNMVSVLPCSGRRHVWTDYLFACCASTLHHCAITQNVWCKLLLTHHVPPNHVCTGHRSAGWSCLAGSIHKCNLPVCSGWPKGKRQEKVYGQLHCIARDSVTHSNAVYSHGCIFFFSNPSVPADSFLRMESKVISKSFQIMFVKLKTFHVKLADRLSCLSSWTKEDQW